jgi:Winged helix DNA-binding domain
MTARRASATKLTAAEVARARRVGHRLASPVAAPSQAVAALVAMQAQDHAGALWSIGLRTTAITEDAVEDAIARAEIVRTWPLRRTLHVVAAADVRWLLALLGPRAIAASASRAKALGLAAADVDRARATMLTALGGGGRLERDDAMATLGRAGLDVDGQRGYHLLVRLALEGVLCLGPRAGKRQTFVLVDEWVPPTPARPRSQALIDLATRYFTSHGPATMADYVGWCGLTAADAKAGLAGAGAALTEVDVDGVAHWMAADASVPRASPGTVELLPGFDELVLGYKRREVFLDPAHFERIVPGGNGVFRPTVLVDGRVVGTWTRVARAKADRLLVTPFTALTAAARRGLEPAAARLAAFVDRPLAIEVAS